MLGGPGLVVLGGDDVGSLEIAIGFGAAIGLAIGRDRRCREPDVQPRTVVRPHDLTARSSGRLGGADRRRCLRSAPDLRAQRHRPVRHRHHRMATLRRCRSRRRPRPPSHRLQRTGRGRRGRVRDWRDRHRGALVVDQPAALERCDGRLHRRRLHRRHAVAAGHLGRRHQPGAQSGDGDLRRHRPERTRARCGCSCSSPIASAFAGLLVWLAIDDATIDDTVFDDTVLEDVSDAVQELVD